MLGSNRAQKQSRGKGFKSLCPLLTAMIMGKGEIVMKFSPTKKVDATAMAEQLAAWNEKGVYAGKTGVFDYYPKQHEIVFRAYP